MDPLSIAASIAGLLTITGAIISKGYAGINRAKKNGSDLQALLKEVAVFSGILIGIKSQFPETELSSSPLQWLAEDHAKMWKDNLKDCEQTLKELVSIVDSLASAKVVRLVVKGDSLNANVEKLVLKIERFKSFFVLCLQLQANTESRETVRLTSEILSVVQGIAAGQDLLKKEIESKAASETRNKIIDWLGITSRGVQDDLSKVRSAQSAQWLLSRDEFSIWLSSEESRHLWLWGIQGSGKSVIMSRIIEAIQENALEDGEALIYHYCRFSDAATLKPEKLIGGLIAQLLNASPDDSGHSESLVKAFDHYRSSSYPNITELVKAFHEVSLSFSKVFIIIDGLDEIPHRKEILNFLTDLTLDHATIYKSFIASRPEFDIEEAFQSHMMVAITEDDIRVDLEAYVLQQLSNLEISDSSGMGQNAIATELVERAQGMFLWAVCQIDHLSRIRTAITIDVLTDLPRGLLRTFEGVLLTLEDEDQQLALEILRVIMFAKRPLDLLEVVEAAAVTSDVQSLQQLHQKKLRRPTDVFNLCGSLIRQSHSDGRIYLAHFSVKEFLSRPHLGQHRKNPFFLDTMTSEVKQLDTCLTYLSFSDLVSSMYFESLKLKEGDEHVDSDILIFAEAPLLGYAANEWLAHAKTLDDKAMSSVWPQIQRFLFSEDLSFKSWLFVSQDSHGLHKFPNGTRPIHVASLYGIEGLVLRLCMADPNCLSLKTTDGRTALHIAIENEHDKVVDVMLYHKAPLDIVDNQSRTPLHVAIESGSELVVKKLVTAGANVNAVQSNGETAISVAIQNKWDALADFLLAQANLKILLPDGRSLLHIAAQSGSLPWTTKLLSRYERELIKRGDVNGWTPLHYASDNGHVAIVEELISARCPIRASDKIGWTPLHAAIHRKHYEIATLILETKWETYEVESQATTTGAASPAISPPTLPSSDAHEGFFSSTFGGQSGSSARNSPSSRPAEGSARSGKYPSSAYDSPSNRRSAFRSRASLTGSSSLWTLGGRTPTHFQPSPLHLAVEESSTEAVELLLKYPKQLDVLSIGDLQKSKCLHTVIDKRHIELCLLLMKSISKNQLTQHVLDLLALESDDIIAGLKIALTHDDVYCGSILNAANAQKKQQISDVLRIWPDPEGKYISQALSQVPINNIVSTKGRRNLAKTFMECDIPVKHLLMESERKSMLSIALGNFDYGFAKVLIEQGANVDKCDEEGNPPLLTLAKPGRPQQLSQTELSLWLEIARLCVEKSANINISNWIGETPLLMSLRSALDNVGLERESWLKFAKLLIEHGANINVCDEGGATPLILVCSAWKNNFFQGRGAILEFATQLVDRGANVDFRDKEGNTPLLILASSEVHESQSQGNSSWLDFAKLLVSRGADIQATDERCRGICHKAASHGNAKMLEFALTTLQLSVSVRDKYSRSPLFLAVEGGWDILVSRIIEHLLSQGGNAGIIEAMDYGDLRSSPLLRASVDRTQRKASILFALVVAEESAFQQLPAQRRNELEKLRTSLYFEALCWAIECGFPAGFAFLLQKVPLDVLFSRKNLDGDGVLHCACSQVGDDYLKTLLQSLSGYPHAISALNATNPIKRHSPIDISIAAKASDKILLLLSAGVVPTKTQVERSLRLKNVDLREVLHEYEIDEQNISSVGQNLPASAESQEIVD